MGVMGWGLEAAGKFFRRCTKGEGGLRKTCVLSINVFFHHWALEQRSGRATAGKLLRIASRAFSFLEKIGIPDENIIILWKIDTS